MDWRGGRDMERLVVSKDGFYGVFHKPKHFITKSKALMVLGGSEGNENIPIKMGELFANEGIPALGICYFNVEGLPKDMVNIPLEPFEKAIQWLKAQGYEHIYMYGISQGSKTALLCASLFQQIEGVIALSPFHMICSGVVGNHLFSKKFVDESEFSYHGTPFSYIKPNRSALQGLKNFVIERQLNVSYTYEEAFSPSNEHAAIPVENIKGNILFIFPSEDTMWSSQKSVSYMVQRLENKGFPYKVDVIEYEKASHILLPIKTPILKLFRVERRYPNECRKSRQDAFEKCIAWILDQ